MNRYPTGNEIRCRFYFAIRELTTAEEATFLEGNGLPSGVGYDPHAVECIYEPPESKPATLEGASVVRDAVGAYHVILTPEDIQTGLWRYRGRGVNTEGTAIATTPTGVFTAYKDF